MTLWEKFKLFVWAWRRLKDMEKLKGLLSKFDGLKSLLGLLGIAGYYAAIGYGVTPPESVLTVSYGLLGVGLVSKLDKATGIVRRVLPILTSVLDLLEKKKKEEVK